LHCAVYEFNATDYDVEMKEDLPREKIIEKRQMSMV
jgi:hypothetical protein